MVDAAQKLRARLRDEFAGGVFPAEGLKATAEFAKNPKAQQLLGVFGGGRIINPKKAQFLINGNWSWSSTSSLSWSWSWSWRKP